MSNDIIEHISSDEISIETVSTDTTLIINASKCIFCLKILGYQGRFASNVKYHYSCLEDQPCIFCGCCGLNTLCSSSDCINVFHIFCLQRFCATSCTEDLKCCLHYEKKREKLHKWTLSFRKIANSIQTDDFRLEEYKFLKGDIKANLLSHGQIFWSIIGTQYFLKSAKLHKLPIFSKKSKLKKTDSNNKDWISSIIKKNLMEYSFIRKKNKTIFNQYLPKKTEKSKKLRISEKELLVSECKSQEYKRSQKEFLLFFEANAVEEVVDDEVPICLICAETDYEDDDLILACNICGITVHMQCYGILAETTQWTCMSCKSDSPYKKACALCPITEGVLKPTINFSSKNFPTHNNFPKETRIWCHVFCALYVEYSCIKDKSKIENIDLTSIDRKKFQDICEICKTKNGACIKCNAIKCKKSFHPECAKKLFLYTRNKTGYEDVNCYCELHKPSKLRKNLDIKEKKLYGDFINFIKTYDKIDRITVKRTVSTDFSCYEKFKLFEYIDSYLNCKRNSFDINIKWNGFDKAMRGLVEDNNQFFTFMDPEAFIIDDIHTDTRKNYEFQDYYEKNMLNIMKNELKIMKIPQVAYKGEKEPLNNT